MRARPSPNNPVIAPARTAAVELSVPVFGSAGVCGCADCTGCSGTSGVGGTIGVGGVYEVGVGGISVFLTTLFLCHFTLASGFTGLAFQLPKSVELEQWVELEQ